MLGGDGFGEQIAVLTLKGANELFLANEVPNTNPPRYVGIRICIGEGSLWAIEGIVHYKAMHGILSGHYSAGVHSPECHACKVTACLRNGYEKGV